MEGVQATDTDAARPELPQLPWAFIDCPTDDLVVLIAHMLNRLIEHNDQVILTPSTLTRFHSRAPPQITVIDYLRRIVKYTNLEKLPLLSLLAYIDITCQSLPTFTLSSLTVHRFLIAGVTAGSKALCDVFCTNGHYAKVGGIKVGELNALEREFVKVTDWALCVHAELLQQYYSSLIRSHGGYTQAPEPVLGGPFTRFPLEQRQSNPSDPVPASSPIDEGGAMEGIKINVERSASILAEDREEAAEGEPTSGSTGQGLSVPSRGRTTQDSPDISVSSGSALGTGGANSSLEEVRERDDDVDMNTAGQTRGLPVGHTHITSPSLQQANASSNPSSGGHAPSSYDSSSLSDRSHTRAPVRNRRSQGQGRSLSGSSALGLGIGTVASPRVSPAEASGSASRVEVANGAQSGSQDGSRAGQGQAHRSMSAAVVHTFPGGSSETPEFAAASDPTRPIRHSLPANGSASPSNGSGTGAHHGPAHAIKGFVGGLLRSKSWADVGKSKGKTAERDRDRREAQVSAFSPSSTSNSAASNSTRPKPAGSVTPRVRTRSDRSPSVTRLAGAGNGRAQSSDRRETRRSRRVVEGDQPVQGGPEANAAVDLAGEGGRRGREREEAATGTGVG